jgi:AcrR family transcriptional regulator
MIGLPNPQPRARGEETRDRLIAAGIRIFGRMGFEGASTRLIAADAETNISSIMYHFGGKAELYAACMKSIASLLLRHTEEARETALRRVGEADPLSREEAVALLMEIVDRLIDLILLTPDDDRARFIYQERIDPSANLDILYEDGLRPVLETVTRVFAKYRNCDSGDRGCIFQALMLISGTKNFQMDRLLVSRAMGWDGYNETNITVIREALKHYAGHLLSCDSLDCVGQ